MFGIWIFLQEQFNMRIVGKNSFLADLPNWLGVPLGLLLFFGVPIVGIIVLILGIDKLNHYFEVVLPRHHLEQHIRDKEAEIQAARLRAR